jgi:hypothetical protein
MDPNLQYNKPEPGFQTFFVIWSALLSSQVIFFVLIYVLKPKIMSFDLSKSIFAEVSPIVIVLALIAIMGFMSSFVLRIFLVAKAMKERNVRAVLNAMVIACALCEMSSMFGVVSAIAFEYPYFYLFIGLGFLGVLLHFPRQKELLAASFKS